MPKTSRSTRDRPASLVVGIGVALLVLAVTATLVALDYDGEIRRANDQLDVLGQGMVEGLHRELREVSFLLLAADRFQADDHDDVQVRLDLISGLPHVAAVGHASGDRDPVSWSAEVVPTAIIPVGPDMIEEANKGNELLVMYRTIGTHLMMTHPHLIAGDRVWDLVVIDMAEAAADVIPADSGGEIRWDFRPVRGIDAILAPNAELHREYLILDGSTAWMLELRWTDQALARMGVGIDWGLIGAGVIVTVLAAVLSGRWMQRSYLEADLRASRDLIEQKDLLLLAISHQMRTPLTGIIGFLRLALDEPEDQMSIPQRRELGRMALGEAELVAEIVEDLLLSTRIDYDQLVMIERTVGVEGLLTNIFRATARGAETLRFVDPTTETMIVADPLRVRQLFRNLLSGGRDEGATNWDVTVSTDGETVNVTLIPDVIVAPRSERLTPDQVALPHGLSTVQPRLGIARKLCLMMGGNLSVVQRRRHTEIHVSLPAAPAEPPTQDRSDRSRESNRQELQGGLASGRRTNP